MGLRYFLILIFIWLGACQTSVTIAPVPPLTLPQESRDPAAIQEKETEQFLKLPSLSKVKFSHAFIQQNKMDVRTHLALENYLSFLGVDLKKKEGQETFDRLLMSSTQFLHCQDQNNWQCLESPTSRIPNRQFRVETNSTLGKKVYVNRPLKIQAYFTNQFDLRPEEKNLQTMLSTRLASLLQSQKWDSISIGLYGIDDLNGSMRDVSESILKAQKSGSSIRAVFDAVDQVHGVTDYQYDGTAEMIQKINAGKKTQNARIENPISKDIMHNKFFILQGGTHSSVWTGTANISKTCMGMEENANVAVVIEDPTVAKVYQTEFDEMFGSPKQVGVFHKNKRPNTQRYFQFNDGNELRIHFSPTDDGEHRSIIPMLLSAQKDDELRISMFGAGGIEYVRALQFAAAKGAKIKIVLDNFTGMGVGSWASKKSTPNIQEPNPYNRNIRNEIEIRQSNWTGLNHNKTATLTRFLPNGSKRVEVMIVGSQNWSSSGNDENDENMLTIRNLNAKSVGVQIGVLFNQYFDTRLWTNSKPPENATSN